MTLMTVLLVLSGLVLLGIGGELLVRGAVSLAEHWGVSPLLIGLTLVGFGTSTPELVTSVQAALADSPGIAVGNVVGSNITNVLLILGLTALILPIPAARAAFSRDGSMLGIATLACLAVVLVGEIGRSVGVLLLLALAAYVIASYLLERRSAGPSATLHTTEAALAPHLRGSVVLLLTGFVAGLLVTMLGAYLLVEGSIRLARGLGVSETLIGLTIVAVGTSLPELVTSTLAARRGHSDVALGNIVGSNIFNIFGILGVTALVQPIAAPAEIAGFDVWVLLASTAALLVVAVTSWRVTRLEGALLLVGYAAYLALKFV
jgi:cation:H+ antiporter